MKTQLRSGDRVITRLHSNLGFGTIVSMVAFPLGISAYGGPAMVGEIGVKWDDAPNARWHDAIDLIKVD